MFALRARTAAGFSTVFVLLSLGLVAPARAAVISVNSVAQSPGAAGDCTFGEAIVAANTDAAVDGCTAGSGADTISLIAGTYTMTVPNNPNNALPIITSEVTIQGAGAATTIIQRDLLAPEMRFLQISSVSPVVLNDLTMQNGIVSGFEVGGAVYFPGGTLTVNDSVFTNNTAAHGGAIAHLGFLSTLTVSDSTFTGNRATAFRGGAITILGTLTVTNSHFESNTANTEGGAIAQQAGVATITNTTFVNNEAVERGGAIHSGFSSGLAGIPNITSSTFTGNTAREEGGALMIANGTFTGPTLAGTIISSAFYDNHSVTNGGAIHTSNTISISDSTIALNSAQFGGGISSIGNAESVVMITNSTISGNAARADGGGVYIGSGTADLNNVTITNNVSDSDGNGTGDGGGLFGNPFSSAGNVSLKNTIVAGNHDGAELTVAKTDSPDPATTGSPLTYTVTVTKLPSVPDCSGTFDSDGYNLIGSNEGCTITTLVGGDIIGTGAAPINPGLGPLQDNGGPTETHALETGSPAIDAGNDLVAPGGGGDACLATDQRGVARPVGPRCDIGAFEGSVAPATSGPSTGFTIIDTLPAGVTFVSATPSQGACVGTTEITCNLGSIPNGGTPSVTIVVTPTAAGTLTNSATAQATLTPAAPEVTDSEDTTVLQQQVATADLSITKTDSPDPADLGQNVTFTITVTNNGPDPATSVVVTDTLPAGTTLVSASAGCTGTTTITCTTASLAVGANAIHTIVVSTTSAGTFSNTASVTGAQTDPVSSNNAATSRTTVLAEPAVAIPTLGGWMILILSLCLAIAGAAVIIRP